MIQCFSLEVPRVPLKKQMGGNCKYLYTTDERVHFAGKSIPKYSSFECVYTAGPIFVVSCWSCNLSDVQKAPCQPPHVVDL